MVSSLSRIAMLLLRRWLPSPTSSLLDQQRSPFWRSERSRTGGPWPEAP
jgi:hypothetical protein